MRIKTLKNIDATLGALAASLLPAPRRRPVSHEGHILIIRPGGIGDAALLIPALIALRKKLPEAVLTVLAEKRNASVFALTAAADRVLRYDVPGELLAALRGRYDVVIDTEQWHRLSAVVARLCRAPLSLGFGTNERSRLFSASISYSHDDYEIDSFFHLLAPLGIEPPETMPLPFLVVPEQADRRAVELLGRFAKRPFLALFPGASIEQRRWGGGRFHEVARRLSIFKIPVVVVGGRDDEREGEVIVSGLEGLNLAGKCTLAETAAVIERCAVLISGDSGILHLGVGLGRPTVSLFGPGIQSKWGPKGGDHVVLNRLRPCSPCTCFGTTPPCPDHARCLSEITVDEVAAAAGKLLRIIPSKSH